jgi:hypothetical protein
VDFYRHFRVVTVYITHKLIIAAEYRHQHEKSTSAEEISSPLQALLHALDAIHHATPWPVDDRPSTIQFIPIDVDYNPICL